MGNDCNEFAELKHAPLIPLAGWHRVLWRDERDTGKICPIARRVAGYKCQSFDFGLSADVEIRQRRIFCTACASVLHERFGGKPTSNVRQREPLKDRGVNSLVKLELAGKGGRKFGINNGINQNWPL